MLCGMTDDTPVLLSGVKPTGEVHIGNYFGAIRQFVNLLNEGRYRCFVFVADYHALNFIQDAEEMRRLTRELVLTYLACGLDSTRAVLFKQSDVPAHTELAWIFDTVTTMPYLMRSHAYKDAETKGKEVSVGTFNYPMLMAADILLYSPKVVPVGSDQKQHVEYARDTAEKFNRVFKRQVFTIPEPMILDEVATVPGTDGRKMSKSYGNTIPLFAPKDELAKAVMGIVTDSGPDEEMNLLMKEEREGVPMPEKILRPMNLYRIHKLVRSEEELSLIYQTNQGNYKKLKELLIEDLDAFLAPMRARYEELREDPDVVERTLAVGAEEAQLVADAKMKEVRDAVGVAS